MFLWPSRGCDYYYCPSQLSLVCINVASLCLRRRRRGASSSLAATASLNSCGLLVNSTATTTKNINSTKKQRNKIAHTKKQAAEAALQATNMLFSSHNKGNLFHLLSPYSHYYLVSQGFILFLYVSNEA